MKDNFEHIDDFFKKHLDGYESGTSANLWRKLSWLLFLKNYGIWISLIIVLLGILLILPLFSPSDNIGQNAANDDINRNSSISENDTDNQENADLSFDENNAKNNSIKDKNQTDDASQTAKEHEINIAIDSELNIKTQDVQESNEPALLNIQSQSMQASSDYKSESIVNSISVHTLLPKKYIFLKPKIVHTDSIINRNTFFPTLPLPDQESKKQNSTFVNRWSIDLFVNPFYPIQSLSSDNGFEEYIQYREESETPSISLGYGAEIKYSIKNFFIQSGLNYSDYSQKYQYETYTYNSISYYDYDTTWVWVVDPPHIDPYPISIDSTLILAEALIKSTISGENHYRYLEIPLLLGYQHTFNKIKLEAGTGVSYGFFISTSGKIPNLSNTSFLDLSKQTDLFQSKISYLLYVGVEYKLNNMYGILIKPGYKQSLNSLFNNDFPVQQKFTTFGIAFGLRINL